VLHHFKNPGQRIRGWFTHLLHLDDSAHCLALGAAVGMFIGLTPTLGLHIILILFFLMFIPGNRAVAIPVAFISNPATAVPIFYFNYRVGAWLIGSNTSVDIRHQWHELVHRVPEMTQLFYAPGSFFPDLWTWMGEFWRATQAIIWPLWVGSLVVATLAAVAAYVAMYCLVRFYRQRVKERLARLYHLKELLKERHAARQARKLAAAKRVDAKAEDGEKPGPGGAIGDEDGPPPAPNKRS
jgi:uncharacterized protein